jgi:hypothetical protein
MSETSVSDTVYQCQHCDRKFQRESSLMVHTCEQKRRHLERDEVGVQIGLQAYLRFYEITQGSSRLKNWDNFITSSYYRAFVKFGRHCQAIRAVNIARFTDWLINNNRKIDYWCSDRVYTEYLLQYVRQESVTDALARAVEHAMSWSDTTGNPSQDFLRYGNDNVIAHAISTGRITAWCLYNCDSGQAWLERMNADHRSIAWTWIDPDFWQRRFQAYPADQEYAREILAQAGW